MTGGSPELRVLVGCDLQPVDEVARAVERFGDHYLDRTYTAHEQAHFRRSGIESLAARFAAKEAVVKLLGLAGAVDLRDIAVDGDVSGRPRVTLVGAVAEAARALGLGDIDLSLSHAGGMAMAVAVALAPRRGRAGEVEP